ncbi:hypothetical protein AWB74_04634 [Caballeronia arvi]|uniref:Uncharacterized protein n=1 Tax=Caballeronia arvi TaxID=1777135 RepID=A0A158JZL3_9BURK|nr:hypothetical protein [Caballeronia arvi]SAL74317.1 hypothetical protein AWB74_04634 [Caballeronia arvi]
MDFGRARLTQTNPPRDTGIVNKQHSKEDTMPYLLGWLLGVPVIVLVILYLIFH